VPTGPKRFMNELHPLLAHKQERLPGRVRRTVVALWEEVRDLEQRIDAIVEELEAVALEEPVIQALLKIPGVGTLTATALFATVADIHAFKNGRQLARWLGLTPREHSSGSRRRLGRMSKQGDAYVRMLLIHGARSALNAARRVAGGQAAHAAASMGAQESPLVSHQQGRCRPGEQARAHLVGRLVPRSTVQRRSRPQSCSMN